VVVAGAVVTGPDGDLVGDGNVAVTGNFLLSDVGLAVVVVVVVDVGLVPVGFLAAVVVVVGLVPVGFLAAVVVVVVALAPVGLFAVVVVVVVLGDVEVASAAVIVTLKPVIERTAHVIANRAIVCRVLIMTSLLSSTRSDRRLHIV
jgi:hypothetical protein